VGRIDALAAALIEAGRRLVVFEQDAMGDAVEIVELSRSQGPEEGGEAEQAEKQRRRDQVQDDVHDYTRDRLRRSAFKVTTSDDDDMAMAATSGVTRPSTASGTVTAL
jgi:hypothetical protein